MNDQLHVGQSLLRRGPMPAMGAVTGRYGAPHVSFEFFPPKSEEMMRKLWDTVERLAPVQPDFVSVTYGAGGSTRKLTHTTVTRIAAETDLTVAAHLTCVDATRDEIDAIAAGYWQAGIRHIVALRGDPPGDDRQFKPTPGGYDYAVDLVAGLKSVADFEISVAAYPETHPEAPNPQFDLDYLKAKVDAGASRAITQFFFDPEVFLRFRDKAVAAGITVPIVPGIMPVTNFASVKKFAGMCGASVPDWLGDNFAGLEEDLETRKLVAATIAGQQCQYLQGHGVEHFHFYTLNRADLSYAICHMLGLRPRASKEAT